ncbi:hypothetical protein CMI45_00110 [Candidatus Pacearchaeota archaeon]|nr:hypothetical protein [Candidatus Pacearchaeota archaeon]
MAEKIVKNNLSVRKQFREAVRYVKESKNHIYSVILIFIASAIFGLTFSSHLGFIKDLLREILSKVEGLNGIELTVFILQNNIQSAFMGMLLGIFFGIFPIISLIGNGVVLGYVSSLVIEEAGTFALWRLLPHGIFELAAVFIALGLGVRLGGFVFAKRGKKIRVLRERFYQSINVFLMIILPLLVLAAIIEGILISFFG